ADRGGRPRAPANVDARLATFGPGAARLRPWTASARRRLDLFQGAARPAQRTARRSEGGVHARPVFRHHALSEGGGGVRQRVEAHWSLGCCPAGRVLRPRRPGPPVPPGPQRFSPAGPGTDVLGVRRGLPDDAVAVRLAPGHFAGPSPDASLADRSSYFLPPCENAGGSARLRQGRARAGPATSGQGTGAAAGGVASGAR